jgi:hypothetical protein
MIRVDNVESHLNMMKLLIPLLFIAPITVSWAQQDTRSNVEYLKSFFMTYDPCFEAFYCYEYEFDKVSDNLEIETKLYNFEGAEQNKILKETTIFLVPLTKIKKIHYFLYNSNDIFITTFGKVIKKTTNGVEELVDVIPLDFNKNLLTEELKKAFKTNFEALISK